MIEHEIVAESLSWLGTPFRHAHNIKGVGVDCAMLLAEVYREPRGPIPADYDPRPYPQHWYLHQDAEWFAEHLATFAERVAEPRVGDVALFRMGRTASHGAIILSDDLMIHAWAETKRVEITERRALDSRLDSYWRVRE